MATVDKPTVKGSFLLQTTNEDSDAAVIAKKQRIHDNDKLNEKVGRELIALRDKQL